MKAGKHGYMTTGKQETKKTARNQENKKKSCHRENRISRKHGFMKPRWHENRKTGNQETMESGFPEIKISCQQEIFQVRKHS